MRSRFLSAASASLTDGPGGAGPAAAARAAAVRNHDGGDLLAVLREIEAVGQREQDRRLRHLARLVRRQVRHPDVGPVLAVHEVGNRGAVGRPRGAGDARAGRQRDLLARAVNGRDRLQPDTRAVGDRARAVRLVVDEHAAEFVERLAEHLHRHGPVLNLVEEPFLVRAQVRERDVQVARREHGIRQFLRRLHVPFLRQDLHRPTWALAPEPPERDASQARAPARARSRAGARTPTPRRGALRIRTS